MKGKVKKKIQLKTTSVVSFVFMFGTIIVLSLMLINSKDASAAYKMKVSDLIESVVSNDSKAAGEMLKENKIQDAVDQLLKQTLDMLVRSGNYEVTEEQSQQIEESLRDMLTTMTEQDLIEFTQDGELSTFSKYYLADAVAYSVTSAIGNDTITVNQETIDNQFVLENLNNDVLDLRVKYEALANKYENVTGSKFDSSNFQEILNQYAILDKETYNQLTNGSNGANGANGTNGTNGLDGESPESMLEMMLKIQALETMVKTLTNTEYNNTSNTLTSETVIQLDTITREIERIKESMSNGDSPNPGDLYNISELTETLLKLSEKVNGMDLSGIDRNNASILIEIQERQNAITQLQEQIKEFTTNNTESTETKTLVEKLESMTKELETLKSQVTVQNTTNETNREVWTKETNTKIETILKQIETIQGGDKTTSATINNLKQTINTMQQTINNMQNNAPSGGEAPDVDLTDVYSSIAAVKLQIISGSDNLLETAFSELQGDTVAAKVGCLSQTMSARADELEQNQDALNTYVSGEITNKITNLNEWKETVNNDWTQITTSITKLQDAVSSGAISNTQVTELTQELNTKIENLQTKLGDIYNISGDTTLIDYITNLGDTLQTVNENINEITNITVNGEDTNITEIIKNQQDLIENIQNEYTTINNHIDETIQAQLNANKAAIDELKAQINGDPDNPGNTTIVEQITNLQNIINGDGSEGSGDSILTQIQNIQNQISNGLGQDAIDAETNNRIASDAAIKAELEEQLRDICTLYNQQIEDAAAGQQSNLDELANKLTNTNDLLQTLTNNTSSDITAIKDTNDWVTNITLKASEGTDDPTAGLFYMHPANATKYPNYPSDKWFEWIIPDNCIPNNGNDHDVTFRAYNADAGIPESDITIVYAGAPVIVMRYVVEDGELHIFTPNPNKVGDVTISSMHVQNMLISEDM